MALEREPVLLLPRNFIFLRHVLAGHAHVVILVNVPQSIINHRIDHFLIAQPESRTRALQQIRAVRHRLHPARHHHFRFAQLHRLRRQPHRLQPGSAYLINSHRGHAWVQPAAQSRLPRRILPQPGLHHVSQDRFVHNPRLNPRPAHHFRHHFRAQFRRRQRR